MLSDLGPVVAEGLVSFCRSFDIDKVRMLFTHENEGKSFIEICNEVGKRSDCPPLKYRSYRSRINKSSHLILPLI